MQTPALVTLTNTMALPVEREESLSLQELSIIQRVPIAMVGLNFGRYIIDTQLLKGTGAPYFQLSGICDINRGLAKEVSEASGVKTYSGLDEILADPKIAAVGLFTGPQGRAELIRKIIRAGKHVMTTKPFELDPDAALSVLREARERGMCLHLNSPAPVPAPDIQQIESWRKHYDLGRPVACRADVWAGYSEKADGSWLDDPERCPVAPIFRLGIYLINDLIEIFGEPAEVQVFASRLTTGRPTPDTAQLGIRFRNGGLANVFSSFCIRDGDHYRNSLVLNFQDGTVYRNVGPCRAKDAGNVISELSLVTTGNGVRSVAAQTQIEASGHYRWDLFHRAIRGQAIEGEISAEKIVSGIRVIRAMSMALREGKSVLFAE